MINVIVHQMGKVGSRALYEACSVQGLQASHVHWTDDTRYVIPFRYPVDRNVSAFFENYQFYLSKLPEDYTTQDLASLFLNTFIHDEPDTWVQDELLEKHPLPEKFSETMQANGFCRFHQALFLKSELPDMVKTRIVSKFLDTPVVIGKVRQTIDHPMIGPAYSSFLRDVRLPTEYLDRMENTWVAQNVYSEAERKNARWRWGL